MRIARRVVLGLLLGLVVLGAFAAWQAYELRQDVTDAEADVNRLDAALRNDDVAARNAAAADLKTHAASAEGRANGFVFDLGGHVPVLGDDVQGVAALTRSLDTLAGSAIDPLLTTVDTLDGVTGGGRIDVDKLRSVQRPVAEARAAAAEARAEVADLDSSGYLRSIRSRFDEYVERLDSLDDGLAAGDQALEILPGVLGADGPRDFLLVFQNNAEIRATGGIPGSWAQVHADDGAVAIVKQGSSSSFQTIENKPVPITKAERKVYSKLLGIYWQDATFTPNWPRAVELMQQRWEAQFAPTQLDGVASLDPVAMSYLMAGTGPVAVGDVTLDAGNLVDQLLNQPYLRLDSAGQDAFFAEAARSVFDAVTGDVADPLELVRGLDRAVGERRFLFTSFDDQEAESLRGAGITGELLDDDGRNPRVVVALNDATASKMSYYLRYETSLTSTGCQDGVQTLEGTTSLSQTIAAADAQTLPETISGPGDIGIPKGAQLVVVRLHTPTGGELTGVAVAGQEFPVKAVQLDGRGVMTLVVQLDGSTPQDVTWSMTTGPGQTGSGVVQVTPGIEPTSEDARFASSC